LSAVAYSQVGLTDVLEEIQEGMKHKNPQVKTETLRFLVRCLRTTPFAPLKGEVTIIGEGCVKLLGESFEPVRNAAAEALGTLMKIAGERAMIQFLDSVDDIRKAKIKEFFEKAEVKARQRPQAKPAAGPTIKGKPGAPGGGAGAGAGAAIAPRPANTRPGPARPTSLKRPISTASSIDKEPDSPKKSTIARPGMKPPSTNTAAAAAPQSRLAPRQSMAPPARTVSPTLPAPKKPVVEEPPAPKLGRGLMGRVVPTSKHLLIQVYSNSNGTTNDKS
jgi:cytoskeleton-associated protein 5